eukprot:1049849_1
MATMQSLLTILCIACANADIHNHMPTVDESWIFGMIVFGFCGSFLLICVIIVAIHKTYLHSKTVDDQSDKCILMINAGLNFAIWIFNAIACLEWAFLRTDLFIDLDVSRCTIIYTSNYLFYMLGKYCLHILLLFRLYFAFDGTALQINLRYLASFAVLITIDFITFIILWIGICLEKVAIGVIVPSKSITFCTLYNNSSSSELTVYQKYFPVLFGAQDILVAITTLVIFIHKLNQVATSPYSSSRDVATECLVRKLCAMGTVALLSTFVLFTFAVPFYSDLTFLLPLDALINGLCVLLLLDWASPVYLKLCCLVEICLQCAFKHEKIKRKSMSIRTSVILDGMHIAIDNRGSYKGVPQDSPTNKTVVARVSTKSKKPKKYSASCTDLEKMKHTPLKSASHSILHLGEPPLHLADSRFVKSSLLL